MIRLFGVPLLSKLVKKEALLLVILFHHRLCDQLKMLHDRDSILWTLVQTFMKFKICNIEIDKREFRFSIVFV